MEDDAWPTLDEFVGQCIRRYREETDTRAEDFARMIQQRGLHWNRSTVTAIERGKRKVSAGEIIGLVAALPISAMDFFNDPRISIVQLADDLHISTHQLGQGLGWYGSESAKQDLDFMTANVLANDPDRRIDAHELIGSIIASGARFEEAVAELSDAERFVMSTMVSEADRRAALRFDVSAEIVTLVSHDLWGHGLEAERDRSGVGSSGHITRDLYRALEEAIEARR